MNHYDGREAARALIAALAAAALSAGIVLTVTDANERPWASATFSGARHELSVKLTGPDAAIAGWLAGLADAEIEMRHHILADIAATPAADALLIEALTVCSD